MKLGMSVLVALVAALCLSSYAQAGFYEASDDVVVLDDANFDQVMDEDTGVWMVEMYAPWCGHCKNLTPDWKKAATAALGMVHFGAVDVTENADLQQQFQVQGFPTILVFGPDKTEPTKYEGARSVAALLKEGMGAVKKTIMARAGIKSSGKKKKKAAPQKPAEPAKPDIPEGPSDVVTLTASNFDENVKGVRGIVWMVEFYAPWCGHCKNLAPHWESAATQMKDKAAKFGAVDCTQHEDLCRDYGVTGYPSIKVFEGMGGEPIDYGAARTADGLVDFVTSKLALHVDPREVLQIVDQEEFDDTCGVSGMCVIAFLPHILDSGVEGRNRYLEALAGVARTFKAKSMNYVWAEGFSQQPLEGMLNQGGTGYPALTVINHKKDAYVNMVTAFSQASIESFLSDVYAGNLKTSKFSGELEIVDVPLWDGTAPAHEEL
jgi:protein disulfide-isomerase A6